MSDQLINRVASYVQDGVRSFTDLRGLAFVLEMSHAEIDEALTILAAEGFCQVNGDTITK